MKNNSFIFKLNILRKEIASTNVDAILLFSNQDRFWLLGIDSTQGYIIVTNNKCILLIDNRYFNSIKNNNIDIVLYENVNDLKEKFKQFNIKKISVSKEYTTLNEYNLLLSITKKISEFSSHKLRSVKTSEELLMIQKAGDLAVKAISWLKNYIKVGMTEINVKKNLLSFFYLNGADCESFDPIIAFGKNSAIPHHKSSNKKLLKNEVIKCDIGCKIGGYCSDITRTFWLDDVDPRIKKIYKIVLEAQKMAINAAVAGIPAKNLDIIAREYITNKGYGKYFIHGTGHGLGIDIHEEPNVKNFNNDILLENNVITIEPGIYLPEIGGVRIEDDIIIKNKNSIVITKKAKK